MCMYFVGCRSMKNKLLTERVWNLFPCFSNFWSTSNHKWRRQQQWHLTEGFICTLAFIYFLRMYSLLYAKKIQECDNQKLKVLRTHVISNSKRARTKFKLIGKFKMLRKLKQQKAFPARSLSFCCTFSGFCTQNNKKSNNKEFTDLRRNRNI